MQRRIQSPAEQAADIVRDELARGKWAGFIPGIHTLVSDLGLPRKAVELALLLLEKEGLLVPQGSGKRRLISMPKDYRPPSLRVRILHYQEIDLTLNYVTELQHLLMEAGHSVSFAPSNLLDLGLKVKRVARMVSDTEADAWVVFAAPRDVLEWFAQQQVPSFAMFGQRNGIRIAGTGPDKLPPLRVAIQHLIELGHRKISMLLREEHRQPKPGPFAQTFLDQLDAHGIPTNMAYNLPHWEDSGNGLRRCLDSLFQVTPPTALILDEAFLLNTAQHHLARHGILAPDQVSLICSDPDPAFDWAYPTVAHMSWELRLVAKRIVRWADRIARGMEDLEQSTTKARYIDGGTVGPAPHGGGKGDWKLGIGN
jgi:DNA-binding LacI/PurR family transcriptional regulator